MKQSENYKNITENTPLLLDRIETQDTIPTNQKPNMTHKTSPLPGITIRPKQTSKINKIIQWNIRGTKANLDELTLIIKNLYPCVICCQETF